MKQLRVRKKGGEGIREGRVGGKDIPGGKCFTVAFFGMLQGTI